MKKFIGIILGAAAVVACSKSSVEYSAPTELTLSPVTEVSKTKAAIDGATFPTDGIIAVYAKSKDLPARSDAYSFSSLTTANDFLSNVQFAKNGDYWKGWKDNAYHPYYWPRTGSIVLAAYYPYQSSGISYSFAANGTEVTTDSFSGSYIESNNIANTVDLLWSPATDKSYNAGVVSMPFYHATSWLTFRALSNDAAAEIIITGVTLKKVKTSGNFATNKNSIVWSNLSDVEDITVLSNAVTMTESAQNLEDVANGVLVLPQTLGNEVVATISYTYLYNNHASPLQSGSIDIQLNQLYKSGTTYDYITEWEAGKHYILDIKFGASQEIMISPEVEKWEVVNAEYNGTI